MPLRSFANFKLVISCHKELHGAPKSRGPRPWPMRKSVTDSRSNEANLGPFYHLPGPCRAGTAQYVLVRTAHCR